MPSLIVMILILITLKGSLSMQFTNNSRLGALVLFSLVSFNALAQGSPHTWHTVSANEGAWEARLQIINEGGSFVGRDGLALTTFTVSPTQPQDFGFVLAPEDDFNVAYTLTLTQKKPTFAFLHFSSKACVYVVTANGPAQPDIRATSFHGANCESKVMKGIGENFIVS